MPVAHPMVADNGERRVFKGFEFVRLRPALSPAMRAASDTVAWQRPASVPPASWFGGEKSFRDLTPTR
jgi:hypothetical protein